MNLKVDIETRNLIDHAARLSGKSRTRFVIDAAMGRAEYVILDRKTFLMDAKAFDEFKTALDEPRPQDTQRRMESLLFRPKRWD
ncbi:MAG: DUF1778 domain-containing protein [Pseudomonas sp.]|nr:DUF1778 domain-containing protein [Pseudomonas sp.]